MNKQTFVAGLLLAGSCWSAERNKPAESKGADFARQSRVITMHIGSVPEIYCRINAATLIELPEEDEAMVVSGGDASSSSEEAVSTGTWRVQTAKAGPARRYVNVKPTVVGSTTTLHILTNHNVPYSFVLRDVSNANIPVDVAVRIFPGDDLAAKVNAPPSVVSADEANTFKRERDEARAELEAEHKATEAGLREQMNLYRTQYKKREDHQYKFDRLKAPFNFTDISTDGTFTYVYVDPKHTKVGSIYTEEGKKHKANLPNFNYDADHGVYTITGVVDRGYLAVGDSKAEFSRIAER
jgi:type IV secretory pathway VirB9-like protein